MRYYFSLYYLPNYSINMSDKYAKLYVNNFESRLELLTEQNSKHFNLSFLL